MVRAMQRGIRWATTHGVLRTVARSHARRGDPAARLMIDDGMQQDPYPAYDRFREAGAFARGSMVLTTARHRTCTAVLRSPDLGVEARREQMTPPLRWAMALGGRRVLSPVEPPSMLAVDPPTHTRYRRLVTRAFSVRAIEALRVRTQEVAGELLDDLAGQSQVDLVQRYAALLPVTVIAEILGVPTTMREQFLRWGDGAALSLDPGLSYRDFRRSELGLIALHEWMRGHFERLRRDPGTDILSTLVNATEDGERLTEDELSGVAMLLLAAGFETTVNLLGTGTALLASHPDQLDVLRSDPALWPNAVDEVLRYDSPVQRTARVTVRDTEVDGVRLREGTFVLALIGGANRDPEVFTDPGRFDVTRGNAAAHVAFSSGVHYCLGAALAKMEGEIGLRALFDRHPDLALDGEPQRRRTRVLRGYRTLPVRLAAGAQQRGPRAGRSPRAG